MPPHSLGLLQSCLLFLLTLHPFTHTHVQPFTHTHVHFPFTHAHVSSQLLLEPGDLLLLCGDSRWCWTHSILPVEEEVYHPSATCSHQGEPQGQGSFIGAGNVGEEAGEVFCGGVQQTSGDHGGACPIKVVRGRRVSLALRKLETDIVLTEL